MKIESINEFIVVAHHLNFTSAAQKLHISQSNLSKHIAELENELGVELIQRGKQLKLTAAGMAFHEDAIQIHHLYLGAVARCRDVAAQTHEQLIIQEPYIIDAMGEILYKAAKLFRDENPYAMLRFSAESGKKSIEALADNRLDIAITVDCCSPDNLNSVGEKKDVIYYPVIQEPLYIWCRNDHPLTKMSEVHLRDIVSVPLNMTTTRCFDPMRFAVLDLFEHKLGAGIRPYLRTFPSETLNEFFMNTQESEGIFLVTQGVLKSPLLQMQTDMTVLPIADEDVTITSYLAVRASYDKVSIDRFFDAIEAIVAGLDRRPDCKYLKEVDNPEPNERN